LSTTSLVHSQAFGTHIENLITPLRSVAMHEKMALLKTNP
jgi:hypothetical protein